MGDLLRLDGGAGGGQLIRTALSLSVLLDRPFRMINVRGNRSNPGLRPQHRAVLTTMCDIADASVSIEENGGTTLEFRPNRITYDPIRIDIGTAGSIPLLFDAVLPLAMRLENRLEITAIGGTDVKWSPPIEFVRHVKLPLLRQFGLQASVDVERSGFYPKGGGIARLTIYPSTLEPIDIPSRGEIQKMEIFSKASIELTGQDVADRQAGHAEKQLHSADVPSISRSIDSVDSKSCGSAIVLAAKYDHSIAGFDALGSPGKSAERVAEEAVESWIQFHESEATVDRHLGDQLMIFSALVGGQYHVRERTEHLETHAGILAEFGLHHTLETTANSVEWHATGRDEYRST